MATVPSKTGKDKLLCYIIATESEVGRKLRCSALYVRKVDTIAVLSQQTPKLAEALAAYPVEEIVIISSDLEHVVEESAYSLATMSKNSEELSTHMEINPCLHSVHRIV